MVCSRNRFVVNLLPLLQKATAIRRVVSVLTGGKEGPVDINDIQARNVSLLTARAHRSSLATLSMEILAKKAPEVTFIHNFPGVIATNITRSGQGAVIAVANVFYSLLVPFIGISSEECGERHLFLATSARYPAANVEKAASLVSLADGLEVVLGTNGEKGSGAYSIDWKGESTGPQVVEQLAKLRKDGVADKLWEDTLADWNRVTGIEAI
jgi:hypothetical protein